jgi:diaminohydroxyphosphoribosylaminopyrimidine deaminase/5-amino-6-(5-phosphoribosylamino)uracil reductase
LAEREINEVHVEAGARLNGALLAAGVVDELLLYLAPSLFGDPARGMFELPGPLARLADRTPLRIASFAPVGEDWRVVARVAQSAR